MSDLLSSFFGGVAGGVMTLIGYIFFNKEEWRRHRESTQSIKAEFDDFRRIFEKRFQQQSDVNKNKFDNDRIHMIFLMDTFIDRIELFDQDVSDFTLGAIDFVALDIDGYPRMEFASYTYFDYLNSSVGHRVIDLRDRYTDICAMADDISSSNDAAFQRAHAISMRSEIKEMISEIRELRLYILDLEFKG